MKVGFWFQVSSHYIPGIQLVIKPVSDPRKSVESVSSVVYPA